MSTMSLKVEISAGTSIDRAAACAVRLANELDLCVDFDFNSVPVFAFPGDDPGAVARRFHDALSAHAHAAPNPPLRRHRRRRSAVIAEVRVAAREWLQRGHWPDSPCREDLRLRDALKLLTRWSPERTE